MFTTLNKIRAFKPCEDGWKKLLKHLSKTKADDEQLSIITILDSNGMNDALWCLRAVEGHDREIRRYAVWCARQVQHLMTDPMSIAALDVAERYACGHATEDDLRKARDAAEGAVWAAWAAGDAAWAAAWAAARDAAWDAAGAARDAAEGAVWASAGAARAAEDAARDAAWDAAEAAAGAAEAAGDAAEAAARAALDAAEAAAGVARDAQEKKLREVCAEIAMRKDQ